MPLRTKRCSAVADDEQRFEPTQRAVLTPIFGEFDGRAHDVVLILAEFVFELFEQRDAVGSAARKARQHAASGDAAHLVGAVLHDRLIEGDLTVARHRQLAVTPDG